MAEEDYFADVRGSNEMRGYGALDGDAVRSHSKANESRAPDNSGIIYSCNCQQCGAPHQLSVSWLEFIYGGGGFKPVHPEDHRPWEYARQHGGFHPNVGCLKCGTAILLIITPDECNRHLKSALAAGLVRPDQIQKIQTQLAQQAATHRR